MKISEAGIDLIKRFEGLELESYQDIAGVWTIGYGHTETAGPNQKINEREAEELLRRDIAPRERAVEQLAGVSLNQNEFDALVSFVFNVGAGAFKNSTARKRLNRNDRLGAAEALTWWNKATVGGVLREVRGLTRRRAAERALFLTPVNPPIVNKPEDIAENSRVTPVEEAPRRENLGDSRTIQGAAVAGGGARVRWDRVEYLALGGKIHFERLRPQLLVRHLQRGQPLLTGLSATYLYECSREHDDQYDDVRGEVAGHFVVLAGYDGVSRMVRVMDPLHDNPGFESHAYDIEAYHLIGAILLGIVTYDANLLVLEPIEEPG